MIVTLGFLIGALTGAVVAYRKGGNKLDMFQHGIAFAIIFAIVALFINIAILRMM
ncbi:hypothetical protein [Lentibacter sp.]|uniref:hypothetical protein n=1 Tax=Lentibacter sp. TaxID=2024994 RepID=UPI003F6BB6F5